jgi:hypothetical protein
MTHHWEHILETPDTLVLGKYPHWIKWYIYQCSLCGEEHYMESKQPSIVNVYWAGGGECTGIYPIRVKVI